jgi:predicted dehydrogenase
MDRREFLAGSIAAATAWAATDNPIGISFLGASYSHFKDKFKVIQSSPSYRLVSIWDEDEQFRQKLVKPGLKLAAPEEMLRDPAVEAVIVESDVPDHQRHAKMALEAGKHVHVEKPPAADVSGFRELLDLAARRKRVLQQGYMWRHHPGFRTMHDMVKSGVVGDVYLITAVIHKTLEPERRPEWARFRGGQMFELGSHMIDQMVRLMGRPDRITPFLRKDGKFDDALMDNTVAVFEFPGAMGLVIGSALNPDGNRYRSFNVSGTRGTLILDPIEPGDLYLDLKKAVAPYNKGRQKLQVAPYVRFEDDFKEFAAAIREGKPLSVTPMQDLIVQEAVIEASGM